MREYLRATLEEHDAAQEELRSAHEEMLSANEEFQSTNEELETSKEELQSTNEELTTTIDELRSRNDELGALNRELDAARSASDYARTYADTIIQSVREPLVVLDGAMAILPGHSAFPADLGIPRERIEGRFLHEVGDGRWNIPDLHQRLRALWASTEPLEDLEVTLNLPEQQRRQILERPEDSWRCRPTRATAARRAGRHAPGGSDGGARRQRRAQGCGQRHAGP